MKFGSWIDKVSTIGRTGEVVNLTKLKLQELIEAKWKDKIKW